MRFRFDITQLLLLTAIVGLIIALFTTVYRRTRNSFVPESVSFSPNGEAVAARWTDGTVNIYDRDGRRLGTFDSSDDWYSMTGPGAFQLLDDKSVLTTDEQGQFQIWQAGRDKPQATFGAPGFGLGQSAAVSRDGVTAAAVRFGATPGVDIWNVQTRTRAALPGRRGSPTAVRLSDDGSRIATFTFNSDISVWETATGRRLFAWDQSSVGNLYIQPTVFSPDLSQAVYYDDAYYQRPGDPIVHVRSLDIATGETEIVANLHEIPMALALSPDGNRLAVMGDNELSFWDAATPSPDKPIARANVRRGPQTIISAIYFTSGGDVQFSPDGTKLLVGAPGEVALYDVQTLQREVVYWQAGHTLGWFFFLPAFAGWAVLWGLARRRQIRSERRAIALTALDEPPDIIIDETTLPAPTPPTELKAAWILLASGGFIGIAWSVWSTLGSQTCYALTPFPYITLLIGLVTASSGVGRRTDGLTRVAVLQSMSLLACDIINVLLSIITLVLINQSNARRYLAEVDPPPRP